MTVRDILLYPHPALARGGEPVSWPWGDDVTTLLDDLAETMYATGAAGLAAPQLGVPLRAFTIDMAPNNGPADLKYFVNPRILSRDGAVAESEGCMSFPSIYERVTRAARVSVYALDREGKSFTLDAEGGLARGIQHECDHLDGQLLIDRVSPHVRRSIMQRMKARHRKEE